MLGKRKGRSFCLAGRELVRIDSGRIVVTGEVRGWEYDPADNCAPFAFSRYQIGQKIVRIISRTLHRYPGADGEGSVEAGSSRLEKRKNRELDGGVLEP